MCGGAGTRLWPASREGRPKQFLPLFGSAFDVSGNHSPGFRSGVVRPADRRHQQSISLSCRRAARRDRRRGRHHAGADAARFRAGDRGRCGVRGQARRRSAHRGAGRRSRRHRSGGFRQSLRLAAVRRRRRPHCDFWRTSDAAGDRIRLYPRRRVRSAPTFLPSRNSSRSPTPKPPSATSRKAICGIPATSCFAPACCSTNITASSRTASPRCRLRWRTPAPISVSSRSTSRRSPAPPPSRSTTR